MKVTFETDKTKDNISKVLCSSCKNETKHKVLTSVNEKGTEPWGSYASFDWNTDYEIIQCLGCDTISFRSYSINSENTDHEGRPVSTILIYPKRSFETLAVKNFLNVPFNLQNIYKETIESFNYGNLILCAAGVRALVEGLCLENSVSGGNVEFSKPDGSQGTRYQTNLQGKINGLYESGKLTSQNAYILHEHRFLGNEAVHELSSPSKEDLGLAIEIIENVFDTLYEIPNIGLRLKSKRLNKK